MAPTPNLASPDIKHHRYGYHGDGQKAQQTTCPVDAQSMVHGYGEQREACAEEATHERIRRDSRVGHFQIHVDDVLEALDENHEHGRPDGDPGYHLCWPGRAWVRRPAEPEEADGEEDGACNHGRKAAFWDEHTWSGCNLAGEYGERVHDDAGEA